MLNFTPNAVFFNQLLNLQTMTATNLNYLFIDQIANFAHLVTAEPQTKAEFLATIKRTYDIANPKTGLFYQATERSTFETVRLNNNRDAIIFNQ